MIRRLIAWIINFIQLYGKYKVSRSAAEVSYYLTLSFFPFLICLNWLIGTFNLELMNFIRPLEGLFPTTTMNLLKEYLAYIGENQSIVMLIGGLMFLITSSSSAFKALFNITAEIQGKYVRTGILEYVFGFTCSTVFLFATFIGMLLSVIAKTLLSAIGAFLPIDLSFLEQFQILRLSGQFLFLMLLVFMLYRYPTVEENRDGNTFICSALVAAALLVVSVGFSVFLQLSVRYSIVYGSLTSIIALMTWIFICMNIIICGSIMISLLYPENKRVKYEKRRFL